MYDRKKIRSAQNVTDVSFFCSVHLGSCVGVGLYKWDRSWGNHLSANPHIARRAMAELEKWGGWRDSCSTDSKKYGVRVEVTVPNTTKKDISVTFWAKWTFFLSCLWHFYDDNYDKTRYHHRCGGLLLLWQKVMTENGLSVQGGPETQPHSWQSLGYAST